MDRRGFLAAGGLAAATPIMARSIESGVTADSAPALFKRTNFDSDGLALDPREYAALLGEATSALTLEVDNYSNGGLVAEIEQTFARTLGKEAAMFVPTGTLANHLAIRKLAGHDRRVLVQAESHFYNDSGDGAETLSGLKLVPLALGRTTIELAELQQWVERTAGGRVAARVGVLSIESPVRRRDHELFDFAELERICTYARAQGIRLHLDGARMFNLPYHSGKSVREYSALFDTVYVSLWKHFNGTSGAILAGTAEFIEGLFHTRRMFGGSLPHAWPSIAPVAQFVEGYEAGYAQSWRAADQLIALLESDGRFKVRKLPKGTSRFFLTADGVTPDMLAARLMAKGLGIAQVAPGTTELPMQVNASILRATPAALARVFIEALTT